VVLTPDNAPEVVYRRRLAEGAISYQSCDACGHLVFPPRVLCPGCGDTALSWRDSQGLGEVYSATTVHRRGEDPYNVSIITMDEGFRMMTNVVGMPPEDVAIGMRVQATISELADGAVPLFGPESR